jgi:outer membrane protein
MPTSPPLLCAAALTIGLSLASSANAEGPGDHPQWGLGAIVMSERKPYRDFDDKAEVLPFLLYESRWVKVAGPTVDLKLGGNDTFSAGLRARYAGDGYEADDSPFLTGMAERKASFWLGGHASWKLGGSTITAEALGDASNKSKGTRMSLGIEHRLAAGDFDFIPRLAAHAFDKKHVDYYYGVRTEEATAVRPAYLGKSATNVEAGLRIGYSLAPRHKLSLDLSTTRLDTAIKDSPLVDKSRQDGVRFAYLHLF